MRFIIHSASYDEDVGGIIVLHKLCHHLNEMGHEAFLCPITPPGLAPIRRLYAMLTNRFPMLRKMMGRGFRTNPKFDVRLLPPWANTGSTDTITIYTDTTIGNPLGAANIVRWFLHKPGFHNGQTDFGSGELHIDFNEFLRGYDPGGNRLSTSALHVVHFPTELYNLEGALPLGDRKEVAYCVRKGDLQPGILGDSAICIDGLTHAECAAVLKRAKCFYSFDAYTAYSWFAVLCGAVSFVVPPPGFKREDWYSKDGDRYGVAFGLEDEPWARETMHLLLPHLEARQAQSRQVVADFVDEATEFFGLRD